MESYSSHVLQIRFSMLILPLLLTMMVAPTLQSPLTILDTADNFRSHPASCAQTCSGVGRWDETENFNSLWTDATHHPGKALKEVGISGCNFESRPVVTATTRSYWRGDCPSVTVRIIAPVFFSLYTVENATAAEMKSK